MRKVTCFKRHLCVETVPGDGVYLISEQASHIRLQGRLVECMVPYLTGKHDRAEIVAALADEFPQERVERVLDRLVDAGHIVEADVDNDLRTAGFWEMADLDGDAAVALVRGQGVGVLCLGDVRAEWVAQAAEPLGMQLTADDPALTIVMTDDYLHPDLAGHNQAALAAGRPWLLAKPVGASVWVGPVFESGRTACWECLAHRLRGHRMVVSYLNQRSGRSTAPVTSIADLPVTAQLAGQLTVLQAAKWLAGAFGDRPRSGPGWAAPPWPSQSEVFTINTLTLEARKHRLERRPQCPACGDPGLQAAQHRRPIKLVSRAKGSTADGGHRAKDPETFVATYEHLVSPVTGPVSNLIKVPSGVEGLHSYTAGQNFAIPLSNIGDLRAGLRSASAGKGMSDAQAKASALAEAVERFSGVFQGDEEKIRASYDELGDEAIAPNELALYSEQQFADRAEWNKAESHFHRVCDPFEPGEAIDWTPVWSLSGQRARYLPTASLFFGYPCIPGRRYAGGDSNGNAAGTCLEDAAVQGFMELVERDGVAIWWYNRLNRPGIDLTTFDEPYFARWEERYRSVNRETWLLDVTSDLGIPTVVAISRRVDKPVEDILMAFGAHFDIKVAISRAMTEMNQFLPAVLPIGSDGSGEYGFPDPVQHHWWQTATVENQPYLLSATLPARTAGDYSDPSSGDLLEDLHSARRVVEGAGLELLMLDQTRPDVGLPVVKMIAPGLRHFWPRYAPGRLYDVPVAEGWLADPTAEEDLNPIGMFL